MYNSQSIWDEIKTQFQSGSMITRLILINVGLFVALSLVKVPLFIALGRGASEGWLAAIYQWLWLPSDLERFITRPWTLFTYQFLHAELFKGGFFHILFNMLWLYWFGRIFTSFQSEKKVLPLYVGGGLAAGLFYLLVYNLAPGLQAEGPALLVGASGSVMAIVLATATLVPDYSIRLLFIGNVRLKWIAAFAVVLDILSIPGSNTGGQLAHLGGALFGFLAIYLVRQRGVDILQPFMWFFDAVVNLFSRKPSFTVKRGRKKKSSKPSSKRGSDMVRDEFDQEKIDAILDKISASGYSSLSKAEKAYLFRYSNKK